MLNKLEFGLINKILMLVISAIMYSCESSVVLQNQTYTTKQERSISYTLITPKKKPLNVLVVILNTTTDTLNLLESPLVKSLKNQRYTILLPSHAGYTKLEQLSFNTRASRTQDITELIKHTDSAGVKPVLLIGFGEGAYLCAGIANKIEAKQSFIINAGPYSILDEYAAFLNHALPEPNMLNLLLQAENLYEAQELKDKVRAIIDGEPGFDKLSSGSDFYFQDYQANPMMLELMKSKQSVYWIFSKDYPLISIDNLDFALELSESLPNVQLINIEGKGNFNNIQEMKLLTEKINSLLNSN